MHPEKIGPFRVEKQLGVGGMGVVYLAFWPDKNIHVALKVLSPALSEDEKLAKRFEREIKILKRLRHKNIVRYYGGGTYRNQRYYAMEVVDGGSVDQLLEKRGKLSWEQAVDFTMQLCKALEYAHKNGIVHRDLKPANLFLTKAGKIKLGDFGIARDQDATALTGAGRTVGTYAYMAPEQITGSPPVSGKTDLYATGCLLYEMLSGETPFLAENPAQMLMKHVKNAPASVREKNFDVPIWLDKLIVRLLEKSPDNRPFDALDVQEQLEDVKKFAASHAGVVQQTASGGEATAQMPVVSADERTELQKVLTTKKKKRKKKKQQGSLFESTPVLVGLLVGLLALGWWLMRPLSQAEIKSVVDEMMATEDPVEWGKARRRYIEPYLEDYPDGEFVEEMQTHLDAIEMDLVERQAMTRINTGQPPESEAERVFSDAWSFEEFGDRISALDRYRSLIEVYGKREDSRIFVKLARRQIQAIENSEDGNDRVQTINSVLKEAEQEFLSGQQLNAEKKWRSIITLYNDNREFTRQVQYARARLNGEEVPPFNFDDVEEKKDGEDGDKGKGATGE